MIGNDNAFVNQAADAAARTLTENGANAYRTTQSALVDLFASIGALRESNRMQFGRFTDMLDLSAAEDATTLAKILFYARDIRGGLGERQVFRDALEHCAKNHPEVIRPNLRKIPEYGRWDDLLALIGTPLEDEMWAFITETIKDDMCQIENGKPVSLLGKWLPSADTSSRETRKMGCYAAKKLGYTAHDYKRMVKLLRKHLPITETQISSNKWDEVKYPGVPSNAMMKYNKAFARHDAERFAQYVNDVKAGKTKINASTLYPYEIVEKVRYDKDADIYKEMWKHLPNYVDGVNDYLIIADTSGSMMGRPMDTAVGLALYFAERNKGAFKDMFLTFSSTPEFVQVPRALPLDRRICTVMNARWGGSTNLQAAFQLILDTAKKGNVPAKDMPKSLIIITDMEFDACVEATPAEPDKPATVTRILVDPMSGLRYSVEVPAPYTPPRRMRADCTFFESMQKMYAEAGYEMPNVVFWNVNSRNSTVHTKADTPNVQLVSGSSPSVFRSLTECLTMTPYEAMLKILSVDRYKDIVAGTIG